MSSFDASNYNFNSTRLLVNLSPYIPQYLLVLTSFKVADTVIAKISNENVLHVIVPVDVVMLPPSLTNVFIY